MKNRTTRIGMTALAILLAAGATVNAVPSFAGLAVVHAEEQNSQTSTVINEGTLWKYLDNNTDPAEGQASLTAWTEKGFDDTFYFSSTSTELQLISRHISSVQPSTSAIWNN